MEDQKSIVRCAVRNSLRLAISDPTDAKREVREKLFAAEIPVAVLSIVFLGGLGRYADIAAWVDNELYQFDIITKAQ